MKNYKEDRLKYEEGDLSDEDFAEISVIVALEECLKDGFVITNGDIADCILREETELKIEEILKEEIEFLIKQYEHSSRTEG